MIAAIGLLLCSFSGDIYEDFFARGNAAYTDGAMADAVVAYEQLVASGVENAEVFFNLANALHHLEDPGGAVLNYERAIGLDPRFDPAHQALAYVVSETKNGLPRPEGFALDGRGPTWIPGVPRHYLRAGLAGLWCALWAILLAGQTRARPLPPLVTAIAAFALVAFALVACALAWALPENRVRSAVVVAPDAAMRYGPDPRDATRLELGAGDRVLVDAGRGEWLRAETAAGERGWVDRAALAFVGPPFAVESTPREIPVP